MAKTIQTVIENKFTELAEAAGLQFITSGDVWLIMDDSDGLDTRLRVRYQFGAEAATFELSGQAVNRAPVEFFRDRSLFPKSDRGQRVLQLRAEFASGDQLRKLFDAVAGLLAPFAVKPDPAPSEVVEVTRATPADAALVNSLFVLTIPSGTGPRRERRTLDAANAGDAVRWAGQSLGNMAVARELIEDAYRHGWASATVGGTRSALIKPGA